MDHFTFHVSVSFFCAFFCYLTSSNFRVLKHQMKTRNLVTTSKRRKMKLETGEAKVGAAHQEKVGIVTAKMTAQNAAQTGSTVVTANKIQHIAVGFQ